MRQAPTAFSLVLLVAAIGSAYAQTPAPAATAAQPEAKKDEVQVITITTGTRSAKAIDKIPGAVTVVSQQEIAHTLALTEDATAVLARTVPGYAESSQAMSNSGENLRGRIALRLLDGIPQGSPLREGTRNGTFTDMGLIGRVEVINGPSASEGIGAAGGIINYITKVPTKPGNEFTLSSRYSTQFEDDSAGWKLGANFAHKSDKYDLLIGISHIDRGISYDGNGRRIGMNTSGSTSDSKADNLFVKAGFNFGAGNEQRLQAMATSFKIEGKGNYRQVDGDRLTGVTNTSERPGLFGTLSELNDFKQGSVSYSHANLYGGVFTLDVYSADQAMRFLAEDGADRQDPLIAPIGTLIDQSEIRSKKEGLRTSYARQDVFNVRGLELRGGLDLTKDKADQRLALTDRLWVPPMKYASTAPWLQASYDIGPVTLSGGYRREDGELNVDSYTTVFFRNRSAVEGGTLSYTANLPNIGAIWRLPAGWSVFAATGKGFTLPNLGIPLRNVSVQGQSVSGILDLKAIIVKNDEVGFNWRGAMGSLSGAYYHSVSEVGQSLSIDPVTNDFILNRVPVDIKGFELSGEWKASRTLKANALYSRIRGKTQFFAGGGLQRPMGVNDINPDKFGISGTWNPTAQSSVTLGATKLMSRDLSASQMRPNNTLATFEEHTQGYTLIDLGATYELGRYGRFTLGIENLTDKQYILSWSQVPGFRNFWAGRGRMVSLSHEIKF